VARGSPRRRGTWVVVVVHRGPGGWLGETGVANYPWLAGRVVGVWSSVLVCRGSDGEKGLEAEDEDGDGTDVPPAVPMGDSEDPTPAGLRQRHVAVPASENIEDID
jgi:hypothetical protein